MEIGMITTLVASSVRSPTCQMGLGIVPAGNATELAPSTHNQAKKPPSLPCSTAATITSARPIVEISAAIGGACRRRRGLRHTYSITRPSVAEAVIPTTNAIQND